MPSWNGCARTARAVPEHRLPTSDALRRAALQRSAARSAEVARQRLRWRWVAWGLRMLLFWVLLPLAALAAAAWYWQRMGGEAAAPPGVPSSAAPATTPAPEPAPRPAVLKLDDSQMLTTTAKPPHAQSNGPQDPPTP